MRRPTVLLLVALAAVGSWLFFQETHGPSSGGGVGEEVRQTLRGLPGLSNHDTGVELKGDPSFLRLATFNLDGFGRDKARQTEILELVAAIVCHFDVVALQEICSEEQYVLPALVDTINASGRSYEYVVGPRVGRSLRKEQFAFVFNRDRVEVDRYELYTIDDPDDLVQYEPLVGWFRARGIPSSEAFTFSLVNVHIDVAERERELSILGGIYRAVRDDRRGEDDVILLGDFQADTAMLRALTRMPEAMWVVTDTTTTTDGTQQFDNMAFSRHLTDEFTGRSGVFDFLRAFNRTIEQALTVSDQLPVWAEFSVREGGVPGRVATVVRDPEEPASR